MLHCCQYLEFCHELLQVDDELLHPGIISFIIIKLFLWREKQQFNSQVSLRFNTVLHLNTVTSSMLCEMARKLLIQGLT